MPIVCHLFPSISPWNVWDLELGHWLMFADQAKHFAKQQSR